MKPESEKAPTLAPVLVPAPTQPELNTGFVTRQGNQLLENGKPFRFISVNVPNVHILEDPNWKQLQAKPSGTTPEFWHRVDAFEQEDAIRSVAQLGGRVIRIYTFSIKGGKNNAGQISHYTGPKDPLNEDLMRDYDRMLALCSKYGVRVIAPFIDEWDWFGGLKEFAALSGGGDFYTTPQVVSDFKALIERVLNRVNTITGVAYKDDPTILAWETGNELQKTPIAWTTDMAAWIKQKAPKQLVADGANGRLECIVASLSDPNVDLVSNHYYEGGGKDYAARANADALAFAPKKPFFVGEFGCTSLQNMTGTVDAVLKNGATGALAWSMRFHASTGGFYWHNDAPVKAYHWPGFASNAVSNEIEFMKHLREKAWAIRGYEPPAREKPDAPQLIATSTTNAIAWKGSVGAEFYVLERSRDGSTWTTVAPSLSDADEPFRPFADAGLAAGTTYSYRIKAVNVAGESPWSPVLQLMAH
jgi:Cellulase (glycosyl hydrolase family 5)